MSYKTVLFALAWLALTATSSQAFAAENTIQPGTTITMRNWQKYKQFMPDGMIALFSAKTGMKMPEDVQIVVGPSKDYPLPSNYMEATEKYSHQVKVLHLPNGHNDLAGYVAGRPFPNPDGPDKGYQILANAWYTYLPHLLTGPAGGGEWHFWELDRFGNKSELRLVVVYRQLAFNTDPGTPRTEPEAGGMFYSQWLMEDHPEQAKYTVDLDLLPQDRQAAEENFVFVPSLRRPLRLSTSARCAPLFGTDLTHDDQRAPGGFNGGLGIFTADYIKDQKILVLDDLTDAYQVFPGEYDMPVAFSKPSWGTWSLRDTWVIDVRRVASEAAGYCYTKRVEWIDKHYGREVWQDIYDRNGKLWKVEWGGFKPMKVPGTDGYSSAGRFFFNVYDLQNNHASIGFHGGSYMPANTEAKTMYNEVVKYSTPSGLVQVLR